MIDLLINTLLQLGVFMIIPLLVYWIQHKQVGGFGTYLGLKRSTRTANLLALGLAVALVIPLIGLIYTVGEFREIMLHPQSVSGALRQNGASWSTFGLIIGTAAFKTAFTEELLFRGFIAKRLIASLGMKWGNMIQAVLFGILHSIFFLSITDKVWFLLVIFLIPTLGALGKAFINERYANGSIIPGWIAHATANILSYSTVVFVL